MQNKCKTRIVRLILLILFIFSFGLIGHFQRHTNVAFAFALVSVALMLTGLFYGTPPDYYQWLEKDEDNSN